MGPCMALCPEPSVTWLFIRRVQFLQEDFSIGSDHVEALFQYAKFQFECGNYSMAAELLQPYRTLCTSSERNMSALWGKLSSDILLQDFDTAREDINKLRDAIDNQTFAQPLVQLQQRTWLLHWALFVFWNHENGKNDLIDLFMSPPYLAAIQINAQHLLRYLAAAVVVNKRRRNVLKDLIRCALRRAGGRGRADGQRSSDTCCAAQHGCAYGWLSLWMRRAECFAAVHAVVDMCHHMSEQ